MIVITLPGEPTGYPWLHIVDDTPELSGKPQETAMNIRSIAKFAGLTASLFAGVSMLAASAARADQDIEYGDSLLCRTQQQAEQLVAHLDSNMQVALSNVNAGAQTIACQVIPVAFARGQELGTLRTKDATYQMVRVLVVGVGAPTEFRSVVPAAFISLIKVKEFAV
ncbi:MAG TPA: hypothetical protein VIY51_05040 [Xanthobacteraceae bacterium]